MTTPTVPAATKEAAAAKGTGRGRGRPRKIKTEIVTESPAPITTVSEDTPIKQPVPIALLPYEDQYPSIEPLDGLDELDLFELRKAIQREFQRRSERQAALLLREEGAPSPPFEEYAVFKHTKSSLWSDPTHVDLIATEILNQKANRERRIEELIRTIISRPEVTSPENGGQDEAEIGAALRDNLAAAALQAAQAQAEGLMAPARPVQVAEIAPRLTAVTLSRVGSMPRVKLEAEDIGRLPAEAKLDTDQLPVEQTKTKQDGADVADQTRKSLHSIARLALQGPPALPPWREAYSSPLPSAYWDDRVLSWIAKPEACKYLLAFPTGVWPFAIAKVLAITVAGGHLVTSQDPWAQVAAGIDPNSDAGAYNFSLKRIVGSDNFIHKLIGRAHADDRRVAAPEKEEEGEGENATVTNKATVPATTSANPVPLVGIPAFARPNPAMRAEWAANPSESMLEMDEGFLHYFLQQLATQDESLIS